MVTCKTKKGVFTCKLKQGVWTLQQNETRCVTASHTLDETVIKNP